MGYLRGVMHGMVIGGAVALLYAPKAGRELRHELADWLERTRGQVRPVLDQAQQAVQSARPQVERSLARAQQKVSRRSSENDN